MPCHIDQCLAPQFSSRQSAWKLQVCFLVLNSSAARVLAPFAQAAQEAMACLSYDQRLGSAEVSLDHITTPSLNSAAPAWSCPAAAAVSGMPRSCSTAAFAQTLNLCTTTIVSMPGIMCVMLPARCKTHAVRTSQAHMERVYATVVSSSLQTRTPCTAGGAAAGAGGPWTPGLHQPLPV